MRLCGSRARARANLPPRYSGPKFGGISSRGLKSSRQSISLPKLAPPAATGRSVAIEIVDLFTVVSSSPPAGPLLSHLSPVGVGERVSGGPERQDFSRMSVVIEIPINDMGTLLTGRERLAALG